MPYASKSQQRYRHATHPKLAKEFDKKTKDFKNLPEKVEKAESSAMSSALFKEEVPNKMVVADLWMNKQEEPPKHGRQLEAAEEGGTLMGRLGSRMSSRDMIDELDLGPKGRSPKVKQAQVADNDIPSRMRIEGLAKEFNVPKKDAKAGYDIEHEHKSTINALKKNPNMPNEEAYTNIARDHLKEFGKYYDDKEGLPAMEKKLEKQDTSSDDWTNQIPTKLVISGAGRHYQTTDQKASNMSDPAPDKGSRKGKNMAEQAKNAGNAFNTMK